jgi:uridine phosphorylase
VTGPIHLQPTAELAPRVLLPGDPGRALLLAQALLDDPKMFNHNRGLWGYTGLAEDGQPLTIQSTGMGGPSAAIVIAELAELGAERLLRVGTCGALDEALDLGELLIVAEAVAADGTSRALGAGDTVAGDAELLAALTASAPEAPSGRVVSTDLFYDSPPGQEQEWLAAGARAVEMERATLFALAARRGLRTGGLLIVSDQILPARRRIEPDALRASEERAGVVALRALSGQPAPASASEETRR